MIRNAIWSAAAATPLWLALVLAGCGGHADTNPRTVNISQCNLGNSFLWSPAVTVPDSPAIAILCSQGTEPQYWDALASKASRDGYWVLVCPPASSNGVQCRWEAATEVLNNAGAAQDRRALLCDGTLAANALEGDLHPGTTQAIIAFSIGKDDLKSTPEDTMHAYEGTPLLLVACENDMGGANTAHALKDAAARYCELQMYSCGVRGADILAAAPNVAGQILTWLKPIIGGGIGKP